MLEKGVLLIDKQVGMTSFSVDGKIKKLSGTGKVGHSGTLDPFASGLLPVFVGKSLRVIRYTDGWNKTYRCTARFGAFTDTMDCEGTVIGGRCPDSRELQELIDTDFEIIRRAFDELKEIKEQVPPAYSAKKINGQKAYELARQGKEVELAPVPIRILDLLVHSIAVCGDTIEADFEVSVTKGTYIRSLCQTLGELTGFGAYALSLRRTKVGPFRIEDAYTVDEIASYLEEGRRDFILDDEAVLSELPEVTLNDTLFSMVKVGKKLPEKAFGKVIENEPEDARFRAMYNGKCAAIIYRSLEGDGKMRIERMLAND